jgi:hypothetical protein
VRFCTSVAEPVTPHPVEGFTLLELPPFEAPPPVALAPPVPAACVLPPAPMVAIALVPPGKLPPRADVLTELVPPTTPVVVLLELHAVT